MDGSDEQRPRKPHAGPRRPVVHVDENGKERRWDSVLEAAAAVGMSNTGLRYLATFNIEGWRFAGPGRPYRPLLSRRKG
jgi:hypothetical protein